jgi:hypothetical protein
MTHSMQTVAEKNHKSREKGNIEDVCIECVI